MRHVVFCEYVDIGKEHPGDIQRDVPVPDERNMGHSIEGRRGWFIGVLCVPMNKRKGWYAIRRRRKRAVKSG